MVQSLGMKQLRFYSCCFSFLKIFGGNFQVPIICLKKSPERLLETLQVLKNQNLSQFFELFWLQLMVPSIYVKNFPKFVCSALQNYFFIRQLFSFLQMRFNSSHICTKKYVQFQSGTRNIYMFTILFSVCCHILCGNFIVPINHVKIPKTCLQ